MEEDRTLSERSGDIAPAKISGGNLGFMAADESGDEDPDLEKVDGHQSMNVETKTDGRYDKIPAEISHQSSLRPLFTSETLISTQRRR